MKTEIQKNIATVFAHGEAIRNTEDILELFGVCFDSDVNGFILFEENISLLFFNIKTGVAGEILQKFSNYGFRVVIVGDFSKYESAALSDFIRECNRGPRIALVDSHDAATKFIKQ